MSDAARPALAVAIVRARYNPFGGAERFAQRALAALSSRGVELTVIARQWGETPPGEAARATHFVRVDPFYVGSLWRDWSFARGVHRALRDRRFAIVQSHERIPGLPIYRAGDGVHAEYLAQRARALPAWRRAWLAADPYHRYLLAVERRMFQHPRLRAVICNSEMVREEIRTRFGVDRSRLHLVRNGVDLQRFRPPSRAERDAAREWLGVASGGPVFAFVGSGFERKGLAGAIRAFARLDPRRDARLLVAGGDRRAGRYEALAARLGVGSRVRLLGGLDDVRPLLWAADAFVLPTLYDPFPNAALEALACGLPTLTSTRSGAAEVLREGVSGYVRDALDIEGLANAMAALSETAGQDAMRSAARESVAGLSLEAMAAALIALYERLIESARP